MYEKNGKKSSGGVFSLPQDVSAAPAGRRRLRGCPHLASAEGNEKEPDESGKCPAEYPVPCEKSAGLCAGAEDHSKPATSARLTG
ncbi:MAG TPA: hypothetical protein DCW71_00420 [Alistipes sp.]|nr:hypothetical protein [Alistipes sp.]